MSPQEWCRICRIPIIHPDVEAPYPGERSPPGYMKASIITLCKLTGGGRVYGFMDGFTEKRLHHTLGILLRCFHILFQFQRKIKISDNTL